jgi:hypothetical protein
LETVGKTHRPFSIRFHAILLSQSQAASNGRADDSISSLLRARIVQRVKFLHPRQLLLRERIWAAPTSCGRASIGAISAVPIDRMCRSWTSATPGSNLAAVFRPRGLLVEGVTQDVACVVDVQPGLAFRANDEGCKIPVAPSAPRTGGLLAVGQLTISPGHHDDHWLLKVDALFSAAVFKAVAIANRVS